MTRQRGFSLIEILVGLIIGLIGVVVIMQMLETTEHQKRTTLSGGDAQINGTLGLYSLSQDLRLAGYGFASVNVLNCAVNVYNSARSPSNFSFSAAPVVINPTGIPAGDAGSDVIQIAYGNSDGVVEGATLATNSSFPTIGLNNVAALAPNEFIVLAEAGKACWLGQITPTTPASTSVISTAANQWNPAAGPGVTYSSAAHLFDLGLAPQVAVYAVRSGNLTRCDLLNSPCEDATRTGDPTVWPTITAGIVGLRASYGRDTAAGSLATSADIPDTWDQLSDTEDASDNPTNACSWARIPAVAVALLARSNQFEKTTVTATVPTYRVGATGSFDLSGIPNWQNYRYKVFQTLIPLRNILWMDKTGC
ncbi:hypothetical protein GALL_218280 [mine drainage metagenome]|uniref:Type IV pilus assembly protein PilW n=1 Tax=mine drainage metagenome TaxID=410659 RepID=A0A1J5RW32_9ZZZZ